MGFKEILENFGERNRQKKELFRQAEMQDRVQRIIEERKLSANERELNRFVKEEREEAIKEELALHRKARSDEIRFGHNPINTENIMKAKWSVLKEPNMFSKRSNMFDGEASVMRDNPELLKNNMRLCS